MDNAIHVVAHHLEKLGTCGIHGQPSQHLQEAAARTLFTQLQAVNWLTVCNRFNWASASKKQSSWTQRPWPILNIAHPAGIARVINPPFPISGAGATMGGLGRAGSAIPLENCHSLGTS